MEELIKEKINKKNKSIIKNIYDILKNNSKIYLHYAQIKFHLDRAYAKECFFYEKFENFLIFSRIRNPININRFFAPQYVSKDKKIKNDIESNLFIPILFEVNDRSDFDFLEKIQKCTYFLDDHYNIKDLDYQRGCWIFENSDYHHDFNIKRFRLLDLDFLIPAYLKNIKIKKLKL